MTSDLHGKIAVVTGAARGIGRATALRLARAGADVAVLDVDLKGAALFGEELGETTVAGEIAALGRRSAEFEADLCDEAAVIAAFAAVVDALGPIDILVNVAGGAITPIERSTPSQMPIADVRRNFDVNYLTAVLCSQQVIPEMIARRSGTIVNISTAGAVQSAPGGRLSAYGSSKAAVSHLTRDLAAELGPFGVRVNAVAPGLTGSARVLAQAKERKLGDADGVATVPLGRLGKPEDIAAAVEFLVSDAASYVTGQVLSVCGGLSLVAN